MSPPSEDKCLELLKKHDAPENIQKHCKKVRDVAVLIGKELNKERDRVDMELLEAASLLHDIGKMKAKEQSGEVGHGDLGYRILQDEGYPETASVVRKHPVVKILKGIDDWTIEDKIVYYSDKRAREDILSLDERFAGLIESYGDTPAKVEELEKCKSKARELERELLTKIDVPSEIKN